jgi:hypothetical protein
MPARLPHYELMHPTLVREPFQRDGWVLRRRSTAGALSPTRTVTARPAQVEYELNYPEVHRTFRLHLGMGSPQASHAAPLP